MPRAVVDGLDSPTPIADLLPGMLQEDDFAQRFSSAFDSILAPVQSTLDCIDSYFDPWLAPPDFLEFLAHWVAVELDELLPIDRQRLLVSEAVRLYRVRGTAIGLAEQMAIYTGLEVEIVESGGSTWSAAPGGAAPGENQPKLIVRLITSDPSSVDVARVNALVAGSKPAHLPHTVEVVREETGEVVGHAESHELLPGPSGASQGIPGAVTPHAPVVASPEASAVEAQVPDAAQPAATEQAPVEAQPDGTAGSVEQAPGVANVPPDDAGTSQAGPAGGTPSE